MLHVSSAVQWWDEWQLRILVLGSLGIQWFLLLAAPMRKYTIPRFFRTFISLAYISSDSLAIYALSTLFSHHAKAATSSNCGDIGSKASILEVLWAPVLLIHLGGQEGWMANSIQDNELWVRHTVTLVSQVAIVLYTFYKSWPFFSDGRLLASTILIFIIGVISLGEKPWALRRSSITKRLEDVAAAMQGRKTHSRWRYLAYLEESTFSDRYNCFKKPSSTREKDKVGLSIEDIIYMIFSDMSLAAAADDLVQRGRAKNVRDVLRPLHVKAEDELKRWLRGAFGLIYTRANVVLTPTYVVYHVLVVPILHITALTLFVTSNKDGYNRTDVKITYILLCLTAALDVFAVFIRQLLHRMMSAKGVPALCETVPGYNLVDAVIRRRQGTGWLVKCSTIMGCEEEYFDCKGGGEDYRLYKNVSAMVLADLVDAQGRDLASYRVFTVPYQSSELAVEANDPDLMVIQSSPRAMSPDKSLIFSEHNRPPSEYEGFGGRAGTEIPQSSSRRALSQKTTDDTEIRIMIGPGAGSNFTTELDRPAAPPPNAAEASETNDMEITLSSPRRSLFFTKHYMSLPPAVLSNWALTEELQKVCGPEIRGSLSGSFDWSVLIWHIATDLCFRVDPEHLWTSRPAEEDDHEVKLPWVRMKCTEAISNYMARLLNFHPDMLLTGSRRHLVSEAMDEFESILDLNMVDKSGKPPSHKDLVFIINEFSAWPTDKKVRSFFHIPEACRLAKELLDLDVQTRWKLIYRVWLGMLFYSASMCRGYLHAKSLGEGGEFLSYVWLVLSLKGARTLADKLQMPEGPEEDDKEATTAPDPSSLAPQPEIQDLENPPATT